MEENTPSSLYEHTLPQKRVFSSVVSRILPLYEEGDSSHDFVVSWRSLYAVVRPAKEDITYTVMSTHKWNLLVLTVAAVCERSHCIAFEREGMRIDLYRYGGHIELIRFEEYYRMPMGHEHISFVFSNPYNKIVMGKEILVPCFDVIMIAILPRNIQWKIIFLILN